MLKREDLVALSKADCEAGTLAVESREVLRDPDSLTRLRKAKLLELKGNKLTTAGIAMAKKVKAKEELIRKGLPIGDRKTEDPVAIFSVPDHKWFHGQVAKKDYVTDGSLVVIGSVDKKFDAQKGSPELRQEIPVVIKQTAINKGFIPANATHYAMTALDGIEVIWLTGEDEATIVPIFAPYYDFLTTKFPSGKWFVTELEDDGPVQLRVTNKGLKNNVVAVIMPFDLAGVIEPPIETE